MASSRHPEPLLPTFPLVRRRDLLTALDRVQSAGQGAGVVHLDLDRFHYVNTRYGHAVGDRVLHEIGGRVAMALEELALVATVDGDGFLVALPRADLEQTRAAAERLLAVIHAPVIVDQWSIDVRASAGIACRTPTDQRVDLVERAFLACRRAKATAPGTVVGYEGALGTEADRRQRVEDGLRRAIANDEFRLFLQPEIDLDTGSVVGVEALLRWQHPVDGLLAPGAFLPSAEAAGLMIAIGDWVIGEAIELAASWRERGGWPIRLWVNLAAQQLAAGDHICDRVRRAIASGRITPQSIGFEMTESSLLEDLPGAVGVLTRLRQLGVELALDDFGTGYSSLSYLRQLPVTAVKIDQRFVAGIGGSLADEVIVEAVVDLAHALGMSVVAEGVEHVGQADALVRMGADTAQGYHFCRPMPPEAVEPLLGLPWCGASAPISRVASVDRRTDAVPTFGSPRARLLLAALDTAHDSVVVTSVAPAGQRPPIVYVNVAFQVETGYSPVDVIGRTIDVLLPHPADDDDLAWLDHVQSTHAAATRELPSRRSDGSIYLCELTISPISDERGVHTHWLHVRRDLTQRRATEGARARFEGLIEQTTSLVFLAETGGQWVYANAAQRRAVGLPVDGPVDHINISDVLSTEQVDRIANEVIPALRTGAGWSGESEFVDRSTGVHTEVVIDVQAVDDPLRPGVRFFAAVSRDVSDINRLARAERRRRELDSFAAAVAHDAMKCGTDEFMRQLDDVLARFGHLVRADRVYLDSIDVDGGRLRSIGGWQAERYPDRAVDLIDVSLESVGTWIERLQQGGVATCRPSQAEHPWNHELASVFPGVPPMVDLFAPLRVAGELLGVLGLGSLDLSHRWTQDEMETVQQVADTLANLLSRQRAADALALSQRRLAAMLGNLGDVLLVIDVDGFVRFANEQLHTVLGHPAESVIGRHFLDLVHPDDRDLAVERMQQTVMGLDTPVTELRVLHADGSSIWFDSNTSGVIDELLGGILVSLRNMSVQRASIESADRQAELERVVLDLSQWALEVHPDDVNTGLALHLQNLGRAMHVDIAFAALLEGETIRNVAGWSALGSAIDYGLPIDRSLPAVVARYCTLEPLIISDIDDHHEPWADEWRSFPVPDRAGLNVPLVSQGRCLGNLGVAMAGTVRVWTAAEVSAVQRMSGTVSAVLARQQVEAWLRGSEARHAALLEIAQTALDLDAHHFFEQLPSVCELVGNRLGVDFVWVDQLDEQQRTLVSLAGWTSLGTTPVLVAGQSVSFDELPEWIQRLRTPDPVVTFDGADSDELWTAERLRTMGTEGGVMAVPMASGGELIGVVGVSMLRDARAWSEDEVRFLRIVAETVSHVLERSRLDAALRASETRFRLLSDTAADVVVLVDQTGVMTYVSPSSTALVGLTPDELVGRKFMSILHPDDRSNASMWMDELRASGSFSSELRIVRADGQPIWVVNSTSAVIDPLTGVALEYRTSIRDISDRKRLEAELERQALHDPLTGLGNRTLLQSRLQVATSRRGLDNDVAVLLVDLDGFKQVNDTWGHAIGDQVLQIVASRLRSLARPSDTIARTGGDEFVLLCPETDRDEAGAIGQRICAGIGAPVTAGVHTVVLGASVGVAHQRGGPADPDALLIAADHAMYAAKRAGRGGVQIAGDLTSPAASPVLR
jgi:diguanylate cyclase (GGDEF)-like protein/PAS domain S-box-containing protein